MGTYSIDGQNIDKFIFHIIHKDDGTPVEYLEEADITGLEDFFFQRLKDTAKGDTYSFAANSACKAIIEKYLSESGNFVVFSKEIAKRFDEFGRSTVKPGVLIVMTVGDATTQYLSLIKFDQAEVVGFKIQSQKAILEKIKNNFTQSKKAMQKSVLINITDKTIGNLLVIDRTTPESITEFFKKFLDIRKTKTDNENTKIVCEIAHKIHKDNKEVFDPLFSKNFKINLYNILRCMTDFDQELFYNQLFGQYASNPKIKKQYTKLAEKEQITGEIFKPDSNVVDRPKYYYKRTKEGIDIKIPYSANDKVKQKELNGETVIEILTAGLIDDQPYY